jgi:DNA-binding response OmpR family regulator
MALERTGVIHEKQRILVIDDDANVTSVLKRGLSYEGFIVDTSGSGAEALERARDYPPDLVILDVMMPVMDGYETLSRLRAADSDLPVIMLTARDEASDQIRGLESGADDYVVKPFTFAILAARVKALLRRRDTEKPTILHFADLSLDTGAHRARRGEREIELTTTEYEVLRQFLLHRRRVLEKSFLMERVWGYEMEGSSNILEVYVKQLRQKLEAQGEPRLIHTIRGSGYILRET